MSTGSISQDIYFRNITRELSSRRDVLSSFPARPSSACFIAEQNGANGVFIAAVRCLPPVRVAENQSVPCFFADSSVTDEALRDMLHGIFKLPRAVIYVTPAVLLRELFVRYADAYDLRAILCFDADMHIGPASHKLGTLTAACDLRSQLQGHAPVAAFMLDFTPGTIKLARTHLSRGNPALFGLPHSLLDNIVLSFINTTNIPISARDEVRHRPSERGTIYCRTKSIAEITYNALRSVFIPVSLYHSGLEADERKKSAAEFAEHKTSVLVCTYGYGSDIWNNDIDYIIFAGLPYDIPSVCRELITIKYGEGEAVFVYGTPTPAEKLTEREASLLHLIKDGVTAPLLEWHLS